ncbi:MAG: 1-deoxy-D-xylulose-5-phosphate reductoisomerase, partial [Paracoccaceae bacterium]
RISVFGATGSIGQNTLDLIRRRRDDFEVVALSGGRNVAQLAADAREFDARVAVTAHDAHLGELRARLDGTPTEAMAGAAALLEAAARPADWIMSAIVGVSGLAPGLAALEQGSTLALANKESLVCGGPLFMRTARRYGATVLPVDSEHSAAFQALAGEEISTVERLIITASGGPFRDWSAEQMAGVTLKQALNHPNWDMGQRITIDSASLFNKAMELIETKEFFAIEADRIEVLIHPESLIHALVGFNDGALMAHLGAHDMRHAIGYALNWPERRPLPVERLDLARVGQLNFETPDEGRFPALRLAREVMNSGGLSGAVFNAAKEVALDAFIAGRLGFVEMAVVVEAVMTKMSDLPGLNDGAITLDNVAQTDHLARIRAREVIAAKT